MNLLTLRVGDWSGDGHERTEDILVRVNKSSVDIETAYYKGVKVCEVDVKSLVADFEEWDIPSAELRKLHRNGILRDWNFDDEESLSEDFSLLYEIDMYVEIYLRIAQLGDPDLKYETVDTDENPVLYIGGYGLFSL